MRGAFVACFGEVDQSELERVADAHRWHGGAPEYHAAPGFHVAVRAHSVDGPHVELRDGRASIVHGSLDGNARRPAAPWPPVRRGRMRRRDASGRTRPDGPRTLVLSGGRPEPLACDGGVAAGCPRQRLARPRSAEPSGSARARRRSNRLRRHPEAAPRPLVARGRGTCSRVSIRTGMPPRSSAGSEVTGSRPRTSSGHGCSRAWIGASKDTREFSSAAASTPPPSRRLPLSSAGRSVSSTSRFRSSPTPLRSPTRRAVAASAHAELEVVPGNAGPWHPEEDLDALRDPVSHPACLHGERRSRASGRTRALPSRSTGTTETACSGTPAASGESCSGRER